MNIQGDINQLLSNSARLAGLEKVSKAISPTSTPSAGVKQLSGKTQEKAKAAKAKRDTNLATKIPASKQLGGIPDKIKNMDEQTRAAAIKRMQEKGNAILGQNEEFNSIRDQILNPQKYMDLEKGGK